MAGPIWDKEVECMPLPKLVELCERMMREKRVIERAARSPLYQEKWAAAGVTPEVRTYADLARFPYTYGREFREAQGRFHPNDLVCAEQVRLWMSTSGTTGISKWIPVGEEDILAFFDVTPRLLAQVFGVIQDWSLLYLAAPSPFSSEPAVYHFLMSQILGDRPIELASVGLAEAFDAMNFARVSKIESLFAFPSLALVIAEGVVKQAGKGAREAFKKERTLRNLLMAVAASVIPIKAKNVFKFRRGVFAGEPVEPYRKAILDAYGFEPNMAYGATEFSTPLVGECSAQDGMHIALDYFLPEIIPESELEKEGASSGYVPQAIPIWKTSAGLTGELVLTSFSDALPLIRYRISDLVQVVSTEPCACGRTHPRIRIRHRSDDIVNLGLIRFSIYELKTKMEQVGTNGQVANWQLRITRVHSKPKAVVLVQPVTKVMPAPFIKEIKDKIDELPGVRQAWQNNLIAEPEVRLVDQVVEERTATGKVKLAVYEQEYFREA